MPDINYGAILEALNDKVDLDGNWSFPSTNYEDLTLGASGTSYTAPGNGYYYLEAISDNVHNSYARISKTIYAAQNQVAPGYGSIVLLLPVKSGDTVTVNYENITIQAFRFIYAQKTN